MVSIIYIKARFSTVTKRGNALTAVNNWISVHVAPEDLFVPAQVAPLNGGYKGWPNAITVELRFKTATPRDDLWTTLDTFLTSAPNAPDESFGEKWDQLLDAPDPDADTSRYNELSKTWT